MPAADFVELILEESPIHERANVGVTPFRLATEKLYLPVRSSRPTPGPEHLDRSDELRGILGSVPRLIETISPGGAISERCYLKDLLWLLSLNGYLGARTAGASGGTDEVQTVTITGSPTGGTFTLTFAGVGIGPKSYTTAPIAYNASVATVQAALEALPNIGAGNVLVAGGPLPGTAITVTFQNFLGKRNVPQMTAAHTFTGGASPAIAVTTTTPGAAGSVSDPDGATVPTGVDKWVFTARDQLNAQTAQIIWNYKNHAMQVKGNGYAIPSLSLNAAGELTAELMGLVYRRLALDTTTVPTPISAQIPPIRRGDLYLSFLAGGASPADFSISSAMPMSRNRSLGLDPPSNFSDEMLFGADDGSGVLGVSGSIPKRAVDPDDQDALLAATTFAAAARWRTPKVIGATTAKYTAWLEMPACQLVGGEPGEHGNRRRVDASYDFFAAYDEASAFDVKWTVLTDVTSLATYA